MGLEIALLRTRFDRRDGRGPCYLYFAAVHALFAAACLVLAFGITSIVTHVGTALLTYWIMLCLAATSFFVWNICRLVRQGYFSGKRQTAYVSAGATLLGSLLGIGVARALPAYLGLMTTILAVGHLLAGLAAAGFCASAFSLLKYWLMHVYGIGIGREG